jgi:hypothetical protein
MAITNAQQYKQLMQNGGRIGLKGGGADAGASDKKSVDERAKKGYGAPSGSKPTYGRGDGEGSNLVDEVALTGGTKTKPKITKTKDKRNIVKDYFDSRKKLAYNFSRRLPGATASSFRNLTDFRNYLVSQGADTSTIDRLMKGVDEDNPISYENFQELVYGNDEPKGITDKEVLKKALERTLLTDMPVTAVPQNFSEFMLTQKNNPNLFTAGNVGNFMDMRRPKDLVNPNTGELYTNVEFENLKREIGQDRGLIEGGGRDDFILPVSQPVASIPEPTGYVNPLSLLTPRIAGTRFLGTEFEDEEDTESAADGGRIGAMGGGIMNTDVMGGLADGGMDESGRQMYFLGKLVKKAKRAVKKITKSPFGKAALLYGLGAMGGSYGSTGKFFSKGMFSPGNIGRGLFGNALQPNNPAYAEGILSKLGLTKGGGSLMPTFKGGITLATALPFLLGGEDDDDDKFDIDAYYAANRLNSNAPLNRRILGTEFYAAEGGMPSKEPVAKKTMPLLDMDGQEMDLRAEGGFVPIGRMERADDVPARLSKNEFVFTADAVRNAGEGDIDKGAEVMYNMMKNLESGGEVSEESQGLDGAREMFQTSKRLEEVL